MIEDEEIKQVNIGEQKKGERHTRGHGNGHGFRHGSAPIEGSSVN